jgi:hypothetical protein
VRQELQDFENDHIQNQSRITHQSEELNENIQTTQNESVIKLATEDIDINSSTL